MSSPKKKAHQNGRIENGLSQVKDHYTLLKKKTLVKGYNHILVVHELNEIA